MTNWGFEDDQTGSQGNTLEAPGGLRQFAEKTKQENEALKAQLAEIQGKVRTQELRTVFNDLGVPEAASLYQGDADPEKAKAWVENMRSAFGGTPQGTPVETPNVEVVPATSLPPLLQQQMDAFTQAGQQGTPLGTVEQAHANVNDATDLQGLIDAMSFAR